jgi:SAM-dependent methyltransferase
MSSYLGRHAELYDLFYQEKPYKEESQFIHRCLQELSSESPQSLLELACGTGNHALEMAKLGYKVLATDYSEDMLRCAKYKQKQGEYNIEFACQDMRYLRLDCQQFDAAICLFDSIGYVQTNEALLQVLLNVHNHLKPHGLFLFEFWHAGAMLRNYEPLRIRRWVLPDREILRISETTLDCARQLSSVNYSIYELSNDRTFSTIQETQVNRYFLLQEMDGWLNQVGFKAIKSFAGYEWDERINEETWHIVIASQKV